MKRVTRRVKALHGGWATLTAKAENVRERHYSL